MISELIDIRETQSGIVADVRLVGAILPISVTLEELDEMMLAAYIVSTVTDPSHIAIADPRTPEQRAWDMDSAEIEATRASDNVRM